GIYVCIYGKRERLCCLSFPVENWRFPVKDKAKRFKSICPLRRNMLTLSQRDKSKKKVRKGENGKKLRKGKVENPEFLPDFCVWIKS
ncbi:MAG: hypothetical protein NC410_11295, partial [Oscillibacter sp.]|nr:hypothetical protein [Oscillibacter sp.]